MRRAAPLALIAVALASAPILAQERTNGNETVNFLDLSGAADWELFRSDGLAGGTTSTFDSFRQRYALDLAGSIWDYRFSRFSLGVDFFRDGRSVDGESQSTSSIGYRAVTTFFPGRPFPLRLFARRSAIDSTGVALADSDRETAAWGAEWSVTTRRQQNARVQLNRTSYDLTAPIALKERRTVGTIDLSRRFRRREVGLRYAHSGQRELVNDTDFTRQELTLTDRTRFDSGVVLLLNGTHTTSDATFRTGERDDLTQNRVSTTLDVPRKKRVAFNVSYDYNETAGRFVDSTSHGVRGTTRIIVGSHWETILGASAGALESTVSGAVRSQDTTGAHAGVRYNRSWSAVDLTTAYTLGLSRTTFDVEPDRTVTSHAADLDLRFALGGRSALFSSFSVRQDENDTSGVGFTVDQTVARTGIEGVVGQSLRGHVAAYRRDSTYDTFQFGVQESTEYGLEGTLGHGRGGVSVTVSTREGISDFIPDPSAGGPFLPGTDLVNMADIATLGAHWRVLRRLRIRAQARYESRSFTSIGDETILSYHPEVEWSPGVWRLSLGITHYERENSTSFEQNTLRLKASRRFF